MRTLCVQAILSLCLGGALWAQEAGASPRTQEVRVPVYDGLGEIDARQAAELGLFQEVAGFRTAALYQALDGSYVLEILQRVDGRTLKTRHLLTADGVARLRAKVAAAARRRQPPSLRDQRGRTAFLVWTFVLGYGFYSWAVPVALSMDGTPARATALAIGSAGFVVPYHVTRTTPVTRARQVLSLHGASMGIAHGLALSEVVLGDDNSPRTATGFALAGSLAGLVGGFRAAAGTGWSAGTSQWIATGGRFGFALGAGAAHLLDLWGGDRRRPGPAFMLAGAGAGYWASHRLAMDQPYTRGDADVAGFTGLLGAAVPPTLLVILDVEDDKATTAAAMAGAVAGLGLGDHLVRGRDFSVGQSRLLVLGTVAGALLGSAVSVVADTGDRLSAALTMAGATGGYTALFHALAPQARGEDDDEVGWSWGIDPGWRRVVVRWALR